MVGLAGTAGATTTELQRALYDAFIGEHFDNPEATAEARKGLADAALAYWQNFNARLPALAAKELAMIAELGAFVMTLEPENDARFYELINSRAVGLDHLHERTSRCVADHERLAAAVGGNSESEALAWLGVVHCYFAPAYSSWLRQADLDSGGVTGHFKMQYFGPMLAVISNEIAPSLFEAADSH